MAERMVRKGEEIALSDCMTRSGVSANGKEWFLIKPYLDEGRKKAAYTIFAVNAEEAKRFCGVVKVKEILDAKLSISRSKNDPNIWYTDLTVTAVLEGANPTEKEETEAVNTFDEFINFA